MATRALSPSTSRFSIACSSRGSAWRGIGTAPPGERQTASPPSASCGRISARSECIVRSSHSIPREESISPSPVKMAPSRTNAPTTTHTLRRNRGGSLMRVAFASLLALVAQFSPRVIAHDVVDLCRQRRAD